MSEESLKKAFGAVWWRFLEFEISRSRMICEFAGNPVSALILQVVAYHNLTLVQSAGDGENYEQIREKWELGDRQSKNKLPRKLSYSAISDITDIDKETVRRTVKKLVEQEWVVVDERTGIHYNPSNANQDKLLIFNEWEIVNLGRLIDRLNDFQKAD